MSGNISILGAKGYGLPMILRLKSFPLNQSRKLLDGKGLWLVLKPSLCWELLERMLVCPRQNHAKEDLNGMETGIFMSRRIHGIVYFTHTVVCGDGGHISTWIRGACLYLFCQVELCKPLICKTKLWGASSKWWDIAESLSSVFTVAPEVIRRSFLCLSVWELFHFTMWIKSLKQWKNKQKDVQCYYFHSGWWRSNGGERGDSRKTGRKW